MSTPDNANLSAQERAALADLEANAAAQDPGLAALLATAGRRRLLQRLPSVHVPPALHVRMRIRALSALHLPEPPRWLRNRWWGVPLAVLGFVLVVLGVSAGWVIGVVGALLAVGGLWLVAREVDERWIKRRAPSPPG